MTTRLIIIGLLAVIVGVPLALRPQKESPAGKPVLVVLTPHSEEIRIEFARGFNRWRKSQGKGEVVFDWRSGGGTSDQVRQVLAKLEANARRGNTEDGVGADLFFGGGDYYHNRLARGAEVEVIRDGQPVTVRVSATIPIELPPGMLEEVFPEPTVGGAPLYHPDRMWVGAVLSTFGIAYNRDVLSMLGMPEPTTWKDLTDPRYRTWVGLADPAHSGSIAAAYNAIVMRLGWEEGWQTLRRIYANARYFTASATKVPVDVGSGEAAAGMCIDFYGRFQAGAVSAAGGGSRVGYVDPPFMTAINADPISIMRGTANRELANEFVVWLLSVQGQRLWQRRVGTEDGPEQFELRRVPIRRDMYTPDEMAAWSDELDPWGISRPFPDGMPMFFDVLATLAHAIAMDVHDDLTAAWNAIVDNPDHPQRQRMLELFDAMPEELTVRWTVGEPPSEPMSVLLLNPDHPRHRDAVQVTRDFAQRLADHFDGYNDRDKLADERLRWSLWFRQNYREIVRIAKEK